MDDQSEYIHILFLKYSSGKATPEEVKEFLTLLSQETFDQEIIRSMQAEIDLTEPEEELDQQRWNTVLQNIKKQTVSSGNSLWWKMGIAASITILFFGLGLFYYHIQSPQLAVNGGKQDIAPGQNSATLTLANGKVIKLQATLNGKVAEQPGVVISKSANGDLVYEVTAQSSGRDANQVNTLTTANGETYHLRLPDNSEVWLNAASSLTYNTSLIDGAKRTVKLTGEAYFEVAKDKKHPFVVVSENQEIKVLGTHFNVNTYPDEPAAKTTLLEGAVQITSADGKVIRMKPGQQVSLTGNNFSTTDIDTDDAVAWTKGQLQFDNKTVPEIMRQIAKWYNVHVIFESEIPEGAWSGSISRQRPLSQVLRMLEKSKEVRFQIDGKNIYVKKYTDPN